MKKTIYKYRILSLTNILTALMLCAGCTNFETEIDLAIAKFPPKLCITAVLDDSDSTFSIVISEGRSLADYKQPRLPEKENKRNGEIRLYEDDRQILLEAGEFDLRHCYINDGIFTNWDYAGVRYGHRFKTTVATNPGSVYRLEVQVDGYKTVTSTSTMPQLPNVSASIDTTIVVKKSTIKDYSSLGVRNDILSQGNLSLWPVTLQWGVRENDRNYYALDMRINRTVIEGDPFLVSNGVENCGIIVSELSKLQDNPEIEIYESQQIDFEGPSRGYDVYRFPVLMMSDLSFANDHTSLTLYRDTVKTHPVGFWPPDSIEKNIYHNILTLRVRHITEATFMYYRSLTKQSTGVDFFTEPYIIIGNIENGYGGFTVFSAVAFQLLEYQTQHDFKTYPDY